MDIVSQKRCTKCSVEYPATPEHFGPKKDQPDGLKGICRICYRAYGIASNRRKGKKPLNRSLIEDGKKRCNKCLQWYPCTTEYFYKEWSVKSGLNSRCINCIKELAAAKREINPYVPKPRKFLKDGNRLCRKCREWLPNTLEYFQHDKHGIDQLTRSCKRCISANGKTWRDRNPEKWSGYRKEWNKNNPQRIKVMLERRAARERSLPDTLTTFEWIRCLEYFNHSCAVCGRPQGLWHTLAMDHWIPISDPNCPGTVVSNVIPLCHGQGGCNNSKSNLNATDWLISKHGKRKAKKLLERIETYFDSL